MTTSHTELVKLLGELAWALDAQGRKQDSVTCSKAAEALSSERTQSWIPVGERLPSPTDTVLTFHRNGYSVKHGANLYADAQHVAAGLTPFYTHWMPLPEAPHAG